MRKTHGLAALMSLALLATIPARAGVNEWTSIGPDGGSIQALAIDPQNPATVYASAGNKATFKSTDGGMSWAKTGLTSFAITLVVDPHNSDTVYAATLQGVVKSKDGGITWSAANSGLTNVPIVRGLLIDPRNSGTLYALTPFLGAPAGPMMFSPTIFKTTDGGVSWNPASSGLAPGAYVLTLAIDPQETNTLYAVTSSLPFPNQGLLFKSTDGGASWNASDSGLRCCITALAIDPQSPSTIYAAWGFDGGFGGIFKSTDGGTTWAVLDTDLPGVFALSLAIDPRNSATLYGITLTGLFTSTNGGVNWNPATSVGRVQTFAMDPQNAATIYLGAVPYSGFGFGSGVFKTTDGGTSWNEADSGINAMPVPNFAIDPEHSGTLYAANGGKIFKTTDGGTHWIAGTLDVLKTVIDPQDPTTVFALVIGDQPAKSTDGGTTWSRLSLPLASNDRVTDLAIDPQNSSTVYAGTADEGVFKSSDGGASWTLANAGLEQDGISVLATSGQDPTTVYAGTFIDCDCDDFGDGIFKSADAGATWTAVNSGLPGGSVSHGRYVYLGAVDPRNPATLYIGLSSGEGTGLYKSLDAGSSWKQLGSGLPDGAYIHSVAIDPRNSSTVYLGTDQGVFRSTDGGENWSPINSGLGDLAVSSVAIDPQDPNTVYAGTDAGLFVITLAP